MTIDYLTLAKKISRADSKRIRTNQREGGRNAWNTPEPDLDAWLREQERSAQEAELDRKYMTWVDEQYERMEQERLTAMLSFYEDEVEQRYTPRAERELFF